MNTDIPLIDKLKQRLIDWHRKALTDCTTEDYVETMHIRFKRLLDRYERALTKVLCFDNTGPLDKEIAEARCRVIKINKNRKKD